MADRKGFLLRVDEQTLDAMRRWADDEMRSLNGHIEWVLRKALKEAGRGAGNSAKSRRETGE